MTDTQPKDMEETEAVQAQKEVPVVPPGSEPETSAAEKSGVKPAESAGPATGLDEKKKMELFKGVSFQVTVELGRKLVTFGEVLNFGKGSVIELEKLADDPVDVYVNQSKIAEGEVVVVDDYFGVRITKLLETNPGN